MQNQNKNILILGAGFAGLKIALDLGKKFASQPLFLDRGYRIILVDERDVHIYTPDLYEIACNFHQKISEECLTELKDTVAVPLTKIIRNLPVQTVKDTVTAINREKKEIEFKKQGKLSFEYLAIALGSVTNYYNIPGLEQFSYPLKTLQDALAINCHLDVYFQVLWKAGTKKNVSIMIGGGGATGTELACEVVHYIDRLCKKYSYQRDHITITLIDAGTTLAAQDQETTQYIVKRLNARGVQTKLSTMIKEVGADYVTVENRETTQQSNISKDILIWTGGVIPNPLIKKSFLDATKKGALPVNQFLENEQFPYIYAAGDCASFIDPSTQKPVPMLAQTAVQQGKVVANNIIANISSSADSAAGFEKKHGKIAYKPHIHGVIIPLGGTYALLKKDNTIYKGRLMWFLRRLVDLWYAFSILPVFYAFKKWLKANEIFED